MLKVTKEEKQELLASIYWAFWSFIWTLLAFWWTGVINQIIEYIDVRLELHWFAIIISIIYALWITFFAIIFFIYIRRILSKVVSFLVKVEWEEQKVQDPDFK